MSDEPGRSGAAPPGVPGPGEARPRSARASAPRRPWLRAAGWAASAVVLVVVVLALRDRWEAAGGTTQLPAAWAVLVTVAAFMLGNAVLALNWRMLIRVGGVDLPALPAMWVWSSSQLTRYLFGMAQVGGRAVVARRLGVAPAMGALSTLIEVGWYMSVSAALVVATSPWWLPGAEQLRWLAIGGLVPVAGLALVTLRPSALVSLLRRLARWPPAARRLGTRRLEGLDALEVRRRDTVRLTLGYALNDALRLTGFLVLFSQFAPELRGLLLPAIGAYAAGHLLGALAVFAPGGIGVREGATALLLGPRIGGAPALVLVAVVRLVEIVAELALFGLLFLATRRRSGQEGAPEHPAG